LITGASSGIGEATARLLGLHGLRIILVARRTERLTNIADNIAEQGGQADVIRADLTQEDNRIRLYERVTGEIGPVEELVSNAGFGWYGFSTPTCPGRLRWKCSRLT